MAVKVRLVCDEPGCQAESLSASGAGMVGTYDKAVSAAARQGWIKREGSFYCRAHSKG